MTEKNGQGALCSRAADPGPTPRSNAGGLSFLVVRGLHGRDVMYVWDPNAGFPSASRVAGFVRSVNQS